MLVRQRIGKAVGELFIRETEVGVPAINVPTGEGGM
jgi:hypothetical protein